MPELILPCPNPKCGSKFVMTDTSPSGADIVKCCTCFMHGPYSDTEESAIAAWNALPRALTWTHEPPVVAGEVYLAKGMNLIVFLVATVEDNGTLYAQLPDSTDKCPLSDFVEWAGPIALPVEG